MGEQHGENLGEFRLGLQVKAAGLRFDAAGIKGLTEFSPRSGVTFGVTYDTPSVFITKSKMFPFKPDEKSNQACFSSLT